MWDLSTLNYICISLWEVVSVNFIVFNGALFGMTSLFTDLIMKQYFVISKQLFW